MNLPADESGREAPETMPDGEAGDDATAPEAPDPDTSPAIPAGPATAARRLARSGFVGTAAVIAIGVWGFDQPLGVTALLAALIV